MKNESDIDFIRNCAHRGLSKSHTAQLLGFWPAVFGDYLTLLGLDDIEWVAGTRSLLAMQARRESGITRSGRTQDYLTDEDRERLRQQMRNRAPKYKAFGVEGTFPELVDRFSVVSKRSVLMRLKRGMSLEAALTQPRQDQIIARQPKTNHIWKRLSEMDFRNREAQRAESVQSV